MKNRCKTEPIKQTATGAALAFHWKYIIMPVVVLLLSIIIAVYFYNRLPVELAYHFKSDGTPDRWLSRTAFVLWMLLPQLFLTLMAVALILGISRLSALFRQPERALIAPEKILLFMGNMVAMPQIVLGFAMLDIFSYNSYQTHIMPLWVFALIVMGVGGIILGILFIRALWRTWGASH